MIKVTSGTSLTGSVTNKESLAKVTSASTLTGSVTNKEDLAKVTSGTALTGSVIDKGDLARIASDSTSFAAGRDVYFVIRPTTTRKTLMAVKETLAELGIAVKYENLNYSDGLLTAISVSIHSDDFSANHSHDPLDKRLVFYDLQLADQITGFEYGTPKEFKLKQRDMIDELSGLSSRT